MTDTWLDTALDAVDNETTTDAPSVAGELPTSEAPSTAPSPQDPTWIEDLQGPRIVMGGAEIAPRTAQVEFLGAVGQAYDAAAVRQKYTFTGGTGDWGLPVENSDATFSPTAAQCNAGLVIGAGRNGAQTIALPTSGISDGAAVLVLGYHADIDSTNKITVTGPTVSGEITAVDGSLGYTWFKTRWVPT